MKLIAASLLALSLVLTGCGDKKEAKSTPAACTEANARELRQDFITASKFDVDCVKVKAGTPFFFVNNDEAAHTVTTSAGAPESFDADLPKKNSTFTHTFQAKGTYEITCKRHAEKMTLIVI